MVALSPNGLDRYGCDATPDALLVGTIDGIVELRASTGAWTQAGRSLPGVHVSSIVIDEIRDTIYAGSHAHGVFAQTADGPWVEFSAGLGSTNVFSLALAQDAEGATLYAGTEPPLLFRRRVGDDAWEELDALRSVPGRDDWSFPRPPNPAHTKHVDVDPRDPRVFYVSVEQGALLKTTDGGRTLRELVFRDASYVYNNDAHRVIINPFDPDEIYLSGGDGITRSRDAGETWERLTTPSMQIGYPDATFCSPLEDGVLYTAGASARPKEWRTTGNANAAMARSRDGGRTWETLGLPAQRGNIEAVTLMGWPAGYGFFVGTTDGDVFASTDRGETWSRIARDLPAVSKTWHYQTVASGRSSEGAVVNSAMMSSATET